MSERAKIEVMDDGPLIVSNLSSLENGGVRDDTVKKKIALCRCGASKDKPFCDGSHKRADFKSTISPVEVSESGGEEKPLIRVLEDGPYEICGGMVLCAADEEGFSAEDPYYLCRCGASENKPFCDGSHKNIDFTDK